MDPDDDWTKELDEQLRECKVKDTALPLSGTTKPATTPSVPSSAVSSSSGRKPSSPPPLTEEPTNDDKAVSNAEASLLTKILRTKLIDNKNDVEVQQKDPNSPLYSVKTFEELRLRPELLKGVYAMRFNRPSKIQEKALPMLMADPPTDIIAQSQSGTGKTAAFVLAMLSRVDVSKKYPQVICLSPTFDLARQTGKVLTEMAKFCPDLRVAYAVRGERVENRIQRTEQIIMGTSGTVLDWIIKKKVLDPKNIIMFVLDEADVMIDQQGQQDQTIRIQKQLPDSCQKVLFSATYSDEVISFANRVVPDAVTIKLKRSEESLENIKQFYVQCQNKEDKLESLSNIYGAISIGQAMIFCHTRKSAEWLAGEMNQHGHSVALITGDSTPDQRIAVLNRFREGKQKVLITTNLCARGIDVEQVTVVINYDIPIDVKKNPDCETYLHRIGRTGRFGRSGLAINFVDGRRSMENLKAIEKHFGRTISKLDTDDLDNIEQAVAS